jgi:hypothetical protein
LGVFDKIFSGLAATDRAADRSLRFLYSGVLKSTWQSDGTRA